MSMNPLRRRTTDGASAARDDVRPVRSERDVDQSARHDADRDLIDQPVARDRHGDADRDRDVTDDQDATYDRDRRDDDRDRRDLDERPVLDRATVVAREKAAFGGLKIGSAFFGWLTALGTAVLLTALVAAATTAVRVASGDEIAADPTRLAAGTGLATNIAIIAILFLAYYCGGYVAGRMARFDGAKQGLGVWVLAVIAALLITAVGAIAGANWDILGTLNGFPRLEDTPTTITSSGVITTIIALTAALVGAVLGGLAGMRFHRRVDRAGLGR